MYNYQLLNAINPFRSLECAQILVPPLTYVYLLCSFPVFSYMQFLFSLNYQFGVILIS